MLAVPPDRRVGRAVGLVLAGLLAGAALRGQGATPAVAGGYWLCYAGDGEARLQLLATLRSRVLARDRAGAEAALAALQAKAQREQAPLLAALPAAGTVLRFTFWLADAVSVQVDPAVDVEVLRRLPGVIDVLPLAGARAHLRNATGDRFTNADQLQQDVRYSGRGCVLAIIDSGIARSMAPSGQPHRTFRRRTASGHRLAGAYGIAPQGLTPPPPDDHDGHGTAVASIAVGADWGAPPLSDDGFAYDADLVSYRVVDQTGVAPDDAITAALQQIALDRVRHEVRVANISLAGRPEPTHPQQVVLDTLGY